MKRHKQYNFLDPQLVSEKLTEFFNEDNIEYDITTLATQGQQQKVTGLFIAQEPLIFVGREIILQGFSDCEIVNIQKEGAYLNVGDRIAQITGTLHTILKKERVVLNLLQHLSGIATTTHTITAKIKQYNIELLDTRKTTPGLRAFEKFAVSVGGGINHRFSLKDAILIKDNHLIGNPDIIKAVELAKQQNPNKDIQVEVDTKEQVKEALDSTATSILLDNFSPEELPDIIQYIKSHKNGTDVYIELSGGITAENIDKYCIKGINGISVGALTHHVKSKDINLDIK